MRKIEQSMIEAIKANKPFKQDNTEVRQDPATGKSEIYLHGNLIARRVLGGNQWHWEFTLAGWNTPTTKSRINALNYAFGLGRYVGNKKGVPHVNGKPISSVEWF